MHIRMYNSKFSDAFLFPHESPGKVPITGLFRDRQKLFIPIVIYCGFLRAVKNAEHALKLKQKPKTLELVVIVPG